MTVEEYQVGQLFSVVEASLNETGGGEGVEAWNTYPYCKTVLTNPGYMKGNALIKVETYHKAGRGDSENVHELTPEQLKMRKVIKIDIANDSVSSGDYKANEDPAKFKSK